MKVIVEKNFSSRAIYNPSIGPRYVISTWGEGVSRQHELIEACEIAINPLARWTRCWVDLDGGEQLTRSE